MHHWKLTKKKVRCDAVFAHQSGGSPYQEKYCWEKCWVALAEKDIYVHCCVQFAGHT